MQAGDPAASTMMGAGLAPGGYGFFRPPGGTRPVKWQGHGAELRRPVPGGSSPIVVDSNVVLGALRVYPGAYGTPVRMTTIAERYRGRIVVPKKALKEAEDVVERNGGYGAGGYDAGVLRSWPRARDDTEPDAGFLTKLGEAQDAAAASPGSWQARQWLRMKGRSLPGNAFPNGGRDGEEGAALAYLNRWALADREIAAQAAAIAAREGGAYLLTADGDLLAFRSRILEITGRLLDVRRPEAAA